MPVTRSPVRRYLVCVLAVLLPLLPGCVRATRALRPHLVIDDRSLELNGARLTLHLAPGDAIRRNTLVVYATGDGGWRGKDRAVFTRLASWGYQVVGFSAPEYLEHLPGADGTATPAHVGADYASVVARAREAFALDGAVRVVLVGVSRGADLAVVAAGQPRLRDQLEGVVVMGLTREEEYVHRRRSRTALELYPYLSRIAGVPVALIQSTRDSYLPAREARALFGADTPLRAFHAIDARNHSFGGAREHLYDALRDSMAWIEEAGGHAGGAS